MDWELDELRSRVANLEKRALRLNGDVAKANWLAGVALLPWILHGLHLAWRWISGADWLQPSSAILGAVLGLAVVVALFVWLGWARIFWGLMGALVVGAIVAQIAVS